MIMYNHGWIGGNIEHNCKTLKEFIDKEIMTTKDKENKYFRIFLKYPYEGKRKIVLYFQDGKLKSHHSSGKKFDIKDVISYEVDKKYSVDDINDKEVRSYDYDSLEELENDLKKETLI